MPMLVLIREGAVEGFGKIYTVKAKRRKFYA